MGADPTLNYGPNNQTHYTGTGGQAQVTLTKEQMPEHDHLTNVRSKGESYTPFGEETISDDLVKVEGYSDRVLGGGQETTEKKADLSLTSNSGAGEAHNNMPPYIALVWCKKL